MTATEPDPLLGLHAYALAADSGLSAGSWRICGPDCSEILVASRTRDLLRSVLAGGMLGGALVGLALIFARALLPLHQNASALIFSMFALGAISMLVAFALLPIMIFRKRRPIIVSAAADDRVVLAITQHTRVAISNVVYDVRLPGGSTLGRLVYSRGPLRSACRIEPQAGSPILLAEPSVLDSVRRRLADSSLLIALLRQVRSLRPRPTSSGGSRIRLVATQPPAADPIAQVIDDNSEGWQWLTLPRPLPSSTSALILAGFILLTGPEVTGHE